MNQNGALDVPEKNSYETYEIIVPILLNQEQKPSFCPRDLILFAASGIFEMQRSMEHAKK